MIDIKNHKSYIYAVNVLKNRKLHAPKYVKKQAKQFINIADGKDEKYIINLKQLELIDRLLHLLKVPKGLKAGQTVYEMLSGYQWLFIASVLCIVHKDNTKKRRYETAVLEICRKNGKTFLIAVVFIILFFLEPPFSKFFSVAPDGALSKEVKNAIEEILRASANSINTEKFFKIRRDNILCKVNNNLFTPLNYADGRLDGRLPSVFLADEVGALPNSYAIDAMRSGQLTILNKLGCIISTKYPKQKNPFEDEVQYCKDVLDGKTKDEKVFSLLYEPDKPDNWVKDINVMLQSNPLALEIEEVKKDLIEKRNKAIKYEGQRENFLTKHCNIIYSGIQTEKYIDLRKLVKCRKNKVDFSGCVVWVGVDLSMTTDNTAVAIVALKDGKIIADVICFIPEDRIEEKNASEKINYYKFINTGKCIACGNAVIDYSVIEQFVFDIESKYNCKVGGIGFDRYNALSSAQKWENGGLDCDGEFKNFDTTIIPQHSSVLHPATKLLQEYIESNNFVYENNELLEINFENCRCQYDTNLNKYVTKKRSAGKVDMVVALINAVHMLYSNEIIEQCEFAVQF